ncbi:MAG TPA: hypothetical protein VKA09_11600 [Nitrososphaeraceae archaeon]|nr:hypothetical protein [Nitrososphaeraceae archaeon]
MIAIVNPDIKLATMFIVAVGTLGTAATAFAQTTNSGIEILDQLVHEQYPPEEGQQVSDEDVRFHQVLCLGGISTEALESLGGCEALPPIGSDSD